MGLGQAQGVVGAVGAHLQRVQRQPQVVDRAGRRGEVEDVVDRLGDLEVLGHVVLDGRRRRPSRMCSMFSSVPGVEVVHADARGGPRPGGGRRGASRGSPPRRSRGTSARGPAYSAARRGRRRTGTAGPRPASASSTGARTRAATTVTAIAISASRPAAARISARPMSSEGRARSSSRAATAPMSAGARAAARSWRAPELAQAQAREVVPQEREQHRGVAGRPRSSRQGQAGLLHRPEQDQVEHDRERHGDDRRPEDVALVVGRRQRAVEQQRQEGGPEGQGVLEQRRGGLGHALRRRRPAPEGELGRPRSA